MTPAPPSPIRSLPILKLTALVIVLALHLFHPAGQAAALPLSLLVLGGAWLAEASIVGAGSWTAVGMAVIGPATMPFYLGVLVFNAVVAAHLPTVSDGAAKTQQPVFVSTSKTSGPVPGPAQGGCGSGCGGGAGGCSASGGGCGASGSGGCGGGCGASKPKTVAASALPPGSVPLQSNTINPSAEVKRQIAEQAAAISRARVHASPAKLTASVAPAAVGTLKQAGSGVAPTLTIPQQTPVVILPNQPAKAVGTVSPSAPGAPVVPSPTKSIPALEPSGAK
jgi:hypothetical protein